MAIDPRIPLGVTPMQITPPMEQAARALQMKGAMQSVQAGDLDLQQKQEAMRQQQEELNLFRNNPNATPAQLAQVAGGMKGAAYGKSLAEQQKAELEAARGRVGLTAQLLQGVTPANFALAKQGIAAMLGPEAAAQLGESYDETLVKSLVNRALETKDWIELQFKGEENARAAATHAAELPGKAADSTKKQAEAVAAELSTFAQQFQATTDQAGWDAVYATLPEPLKKNFHPRRSAGSIRSAQHVGMKADEVLAANVAQQNANTSAYSAQTARQNADRPSFTAKEVLHDGKVIMANFDSKSGRWFDPATGAQIMAPRPAPTAADAKDAEKFKQAGPILTAVAELSERINTLQGVAAKASGAAERQKAKLNLNDDVAEYEALVMGFTPLVARALGHTGVLTEQDVVSVRKLFPTPGDSKSLRDRKVQRVNSIIGQLQGVADPTAPKPDDKKPDPLGIR